MSADGSQGLFCSCRPWGICRLITPPNWRGTKKHIGGSEDVFFQAGDLQVPSFVNSGKVCSYDSHRSRDPTLIWKFKTFTF